MLSRSRRPGRSGARGTGASRRSSATRAAACGCSRYLEQVTGELRKRIGTTFTLEELVDAYAGIEDWARETFEEMGAPGWPRYVTLVSDEAFHLYARGATDYRP